MVLLHSLLNHRNSNISLTFPIVVCAWSKDFLIIVFFFKNFSSFINVFLFFSRMEFENCDKQRKHGCAFQKLFSSDTPEYYPRNSPQQLTETEFIPRSGSRCIKWQSVARLALCFDHAPLRLRGTARWPIEVDHSFYLQNWIFITWAAIWLNWIAWNSWIQFLTWFWLALTVSTAFALHAVFFISNFARG